MFDIERLVFEYMFSDRLVLEIKCPECMKIHNLEAKSVFYIGGILTIQYLLKCCNKSTIIEKVIKIKMKTIIKKIEI